MSLQAKNKEELEGIARALFIELPEGATKKEILAVFTEEAVTKEDYEGLEVPPEPSEDTPLVVSPTEGIVTTSSLRHEDEAAPAPAPEQVDTLLATQASPVSDEVLLKCDRKNATFQILTYEFTRDHPFKLVSAKDADYIVRNVPGFRPALQSEVQEFYS